VALGLWCDEAVTRWVKTEVVAVVVVVAVAVAASGGDRRSPCLAPPPSLPRALLAPDGLPTSGSERQRGLEPRPPCCYPEI
jgi:hypothetical protein